jgi:hypothetical protein
MAKCAPARAAWLRTGFGASGSHAAFVRSRRAPRYHQYVVTPRPATNCVRDLKSKAWGRPSIIRSHHMGPRIADAAGSTGRDQAIAGRILSLPMYTEADPDRIRQMVLRHQ